MTSSGNNDSWSILSNDTRFQTINVAYGVYKDLDIVIDAGQTNEFGKYSRSVSVFDVSAQTYTTLPNPPSYDPKNLPDMSPRSGLVLNGYFYLARLGHGMNRICLSKRSKWELVVRDSKIETIVTNGSHIFAIENGNKIYQYHPSKLRFIPILNSTHGKPREEFAATVVDQKIFIIGGEVSERAVEDMDVFDISTKSWSRAPSLPLPLIRHAAVAVDRWIVVTGGKYNADNYDYDPYEYDDDDQPDDCNTEIFLYDTLTRQWSINYTAPFEPRRYHRCLRVGYQIIAIGGIYFSGEDCPMEAIHIKHIIPNWKWLALKHYILLRALIDQKRATSNVVTEQSKHTHSDKNSDEDASILKLFTDTPSEIFRSVISFMI